MIDTARVLRPLDEAADALAKLDDYQNPAELASALQSTAQAVDRVLRNLLRSDPEVPDAVRLTALSPTEMPHDRLIPALRERNLITFQLAGLTFDLEQAARRAQSGDVRAVDGDDALHVVQTLRAEIGAKHDKPVMAAAHNAIESGLLDSSARPVPKPDRSRLYRNVGVALLFVAVAFLLVKLMSGRSDLAKGIDAVEARQWSTAQGHLEKAAQDKDNATAQVYLAYVYRRQQQFDRAAAVLRDAATAHSEDAHVWRELGYLFMDLNQPQSAVDRFRRAQELDPEDQLTWVGLYRALRAHGDTAAAEQVLQQAPANVRAALTRTN